MKIDSNTFVSLSYELTVDGQVVDKATAEGPLEFIYGAGFLLPSFEENIKGLKAGDAFAFDLEAQNAYGAIMPEAVVELPKTTFMVDGKIDEEMLAVGNTVPMMDNQGNRLMGVIKEVKDESILMDFNHPMAGKDLHFEGKIEGVREVTDVDRAKFMGLGGEGCGCGCGDEACGDSCDCDEESSCGCGC